MVDTSLLPRPRNVNLSEEVIHLVFSSCPLVFSVVVESSITRRNAATTCSTDWSVVQWHDAECCEGKKSILCLPGFGVLVWQIGGLISKINVYIVGTKRNCWLREFEHGYSDGDRVSFIHGVVSRCEKGRRCDVFTNLILRWVSVNQPIQTFNVYDGTQPQPPLIGP